MIRYNRLNLAVHIFILLPTVIFLLGWLRPAVGIPLAALAVLAGWRSFVDADGLEGSAVPDIYSKSGRMNAASVVDTLRRWTGSEKVRFLICVVLICIWVGFSGIGGFSFQNGDHVARNTIFRALVEYRWPVVTADGSRMLVYYMGYWLPSALIGKAFGLTAGYAAQYVWTVVGITLLYLLICRWRGKVSVWPVIVLMAFSGLDIVGTLIYHLPWGFLRSVEHLEWWALFQQFSSMTTQLFWVFNQTVPAWIVVMFCLMQRKKKNLLFLHSNLVLTATLPFIGFIPVNAFLLLSGMDVKGEGFGKAFLHRLREIFSFENIVGVICIGIPCVLYVLGNLAGASVGGAGASVSTEQYIWVTSELGNYILFCVLEFAVFFPFLCRRAGRWPGLKIVVFAWLLVCPLIRIGTAYDFSMRASVPALFILLIMIIDSLDAWGLSRRFALLIPLIALLFLGAFTPLHEFHRSVRYTRDAYRAGEDPTAGEVGLEDGDRLLYQVNFSGETEGNLFYQYLARH
ncbi:MAG: hypothetical protein IJM13_02050 [Lachnospiraceae bacterium]|nr:hypothetical protein [Lachnospiraceae bacterium]